MSVRCSTPPVSVVPAETNHSDPVSLEEFTDELHHSSGFLPAEGE